MKLYLIEYYDRVLDRTDYATIFGFSESDVREQFRYSINRSIIKREVKNETISCII